MNGLCILGIVIGYYIFGAIIYGLMHRYDPYRFGVDADAVALGVAAWIVVVPLYWFCIFCDRCILWFEKKGE